MWKKRKFQYAVLGTILIVALSFVLRPRAVVVESALVTCGPMTVTVDEEGRTRVRERFVVAAPVGGRLERIVLHEGDEVAAGVVMAYLAPSPLDFRTIAQAQARLKAAEASHASAKAREDRARAAFDQAHRDRERAEELGREGIQPQEGRERAELQEVASAADLTAARHTTEAAAQEVAEARAALLASTPDGRRSGGLVPLRAPERGTLLRVLQESDRVVAAGTPVFEIGDMAGLEIVAELLSSDAVTVKPGAAMWIGGFGAAEEVSGRVRRVEPSGFTKLSALGVEEQRVNVVGDFVSVPDGVGDGYRVEVRVVVWESSQALLVPGSALYRTGIDWRAYAIENGRAVSRTVRVGHRTTSEAEVLGGLKEGDRVILYPGDRVKDGTRVE
jgi:HlyD family secretion protein